MRELITLRRPPRRDERGVAAVFFGLAITVLLAALGLSVDVGNVAYQRNKAQDAADAAAHRIAYACLKSASATDCTARTAAAQDTVTTALGDNATGASVSTANVGTTGVKVTISKDVSTPLLNLIGVSSKAIAASSTATWNAHPSEGYPVLPLGVSYCTWKNNSTQAGTANEANNSNHLSIRTDTLQSLRNILQPVLGTVSDVVELTGLMNSLGTGATDSCTDTDGTQLLTFKGGLWLTGENVLTTVLTGLFGYDTPSCSLRVGSDLSTFLGGVESAITIPTNCASKFGPGKDVAVGKTILLPIYKPKSTLQNKYGFKLLTACVGLGTKNGTPSCVEVPPKIGVTIVGFAPFKITGWKYPGTPSGYEDAAVTCPATTWSLNLYNIANATFSAIEKLLNTVTSLLSSLLGIGTLTTSLACNGLQGYFTKTFTKDPNFKWSASGADLGATAARITE